MVGSLGPQADARAVRKPKTAAFWLLVGDLQPFALPNPLDPPVTHRPAGLAQQGSDLAIAITAILARQLNYIGR